MSERMRQVEIRQSLANWHEQHNQLSLIAPEVATKLQEIESYLGGVYQQAQALGQGDMLPSIVAAWERSQSIALAALKADAVVTGSATVIQVLDEERHHWMSQFDELQTAVYEGDDDNEAVAKLKVAVWDEAYESAQYFEAETGASRLFSEMAQFLTFTLGLHFGIANKMVSLLTGAEGMTAHQLSLLQQFAETITDVELDL